MALVPSEKQGDFYLGGSYDLAAAKLGDEPVYYESKDLVTHGVCIGMTGSGKTGLCIGLLEECALSGIPAILIDPKGDLTNLELAFPELRPEDFRPWVNEDAARRKGVTPEVFAEAQATAWRDGLAGWGIGPERIRKFRDAVDVRIFTPGSTAGSTLSILKSFDPPGACVLDDDELRREQVAGAASALLGLLEKTDNSVQGREHILLSNLLERRWLAGQSTDLATLIQLIQSPPFQTLGALPLETFFPARDRMKLAMDLNALLAAPSFQTWLEGEPLSVDTLLRAPDGRPRLSVCYIAHLSDAERMFFVALLLNQVVAWMRAQSGTQSLRALLYFDEIFGFLPPHPKDPPSKRLLMTLLKQGRAFGLGTVLVTQNPVDLDYKALSNCGTWLIGRLQTEQDKARILDGLQGAMDEAGNAMDRRSLDQILTRLGQRVFLLHNVHAGQPRVFHSRWAMSYLAGPLTRPQLRTLVASEGKRAPVVPQADTPASLQDFLAEDSTAYSTVPPSVPAGLSVCFSSAGDGPYSPAIFADAEILFRNTRSGETATREWLLRLDPAQPDWDHAEALPPDTARSGESPAGAKFAPLPPICQDIAAMKKLGATLSNHLIKIGGLETFACPGLKEKSRLGEAREAFEARLEAAAESQLAEESEKLRADAVKRRATLVGRLEKERGNLERSEQRTATRRKEAATSVFSNLVEGAFSILAGRKATGARKVGSAVRTATSKRGITQRAELSTDKIRHNIELLESQVAALDEQLQREITGLREKIGKAKSEIETGRVLPTKTGIEIKGFGVWWVTQS